MKIASSMEIGNYLKKIIIQKYSNTKEFCYEYLMHQGNQQANDISLISKHFANVLKGLDSLSLDDIEILSDLLDLSYEEILTAGKNHSYNDQRMNNYKLVFTDDPKLWEEYFKREDKAFMHCDEYGKSIIDYCLEYKRYALLKYLYDKEYIWFSKENPTSYYMTFKADTSINQNDLYDDGLDGKIQKAAKLRERLIYLSLEHNDIKMLENLKAREIPALYDASNYLSTHPSFEDYLDEKMLDKIATSSNEVLDYFSQDFEIVADHNYHTFFIYPFIQELIYKLIENNNPYAKKLINQAILHNERVYKRLEELVEFAVNDLTDGDWSKDIRNINTQLVKRHIYYRLNGKVINFAYQTNENRLVSNIINFEYHTNDLVLNDLIDRLNDSYQKIINYKTEY